MEEYYEEHKQELLSAIKENGYTLEDILDGAHKEGISPKQFIVDLFS